MQWTKAISLSAAIFPVAGCDGAISISFPAGPSTQPIAANAANTVPVTVDSAVSIVNIPTVSVTVCAHGTNVCQTIDHVQLDTGSYGLRIVSSAASQVVGSLPFLTVSGGQLAECAQFADGYTWGTIRIADVKIGGETASNIPIQIIGDLSASTVPATGCVNGAAENTVSDLGTNGILGIGVAPLDCGTACENAATNSNYYSCPDGANCARTTVTLAQQVANPVPNFTSDNNGLILQMAPVSYAGASSATGTLVFGIGTQPNNTLAAVQSFTTDAYGNLTGIFNGGNVPAFFDSGSNAYFFVDSALTACGGNYLDFYCPSSTQTLTATILGLNGVSGTLNFDVANASALFSDASSHAFNDLAGMGGDTTSLDVGLPFFYGRYVYYGMDQRASGGQTPFVAF